jgi:predicted TIM-barrel fold metal-dependent hydrolase
LWLGELGLDRLLWGSDWPCTNHEAHADYPALHHALDDWLLDRAAVEAARVDNPNRLYWGSGTGSAG